jgi:hypothetical protein
MSQSGVVVPRAVARNILLVGDFNYSQLERLSPVCRAFRSESERIYFSRLDFIEVFPHNISPLPRRCRFRCPSSLGFSNNIVVRGILRSGNLTFRELDALSTLNSTFRFEMESLLTAWLDFFNLHPHDIVPLPRRCRLGCSCGPRPSPTPVRPGYVFPNFPWSD